MRIIIAGGGNIGEKLAELCSKEKHDVVVIEKEEKIAEKLSESIDALVLCGDASDRKILKDADIEHSDAIVAMTGDDKTNLMVCEVAKSYNIPIVVARVNDTESESVFMKLGITAAINTTTSVIFAFKKALEKPGEKIISLVAGEKAEILDKVVSKKSVITGKKVEDISNKFIVAAIYRNGEFMRPKNNTQIREGDILTICVPVEDVKGVEKLF